jgi:sugar phosphate isomerase/epimerase
MRLGITSLSYNRWFGEPRRELRAQLPLYFPYQTERIPMDESLAWCIRKAHDLGVEVLADPVLRWREPDYVEAMAELAAQHGVAVEPWMVVDLMATGEAAKRAADEIVAFMRAVCRPLGATILGTGQSPMIYHRYLDEPPLEEQLARVAESLRPITRAAQAEGVTLALENHIDYWAEEYQRIRADVGSPALRFRLDTANQFLVIEDPVRAAATLAADVVTVHVKDVKVIPFSGEGARIVGAPIGKGNVDLRAILSILRAHAPDPARLPLVVEMNWVPSNEDPAYWSDQSVRWMKETFAEFLARG